MDGTSSVIQQELSHDTSDYGPPGWIHTVLCSFFYLQVLVFVWFLMDTCMEIHREKQARLCGLPLYRHTTTSVFRINTDQEIPMVCVTDYSEECESSMTTSFALPLHNTSISADALLSPPQASGSL